MKPIYSAHAQEDRKYWEKHDPKMVARLDLLLDDIARHPSTGIGRPEPLRFQKSGYWSRRINREHRLVYKVVKKQIYVVQCRYHY